MATATARCEDSDESHWRGESYLEQWQALFDHGGAGNLLDALEVEQRHSKMPDFSAEVSFSKTM